MPGDRRAAQVARIREYVNSARTEGVSRYVIRIDRQGFSIFDSAHEVNLYAYMRFIRDSSATEAAVLDEYAKKRFGRAAGKMIPLLQSELEMVRDINYVASNLTFHAFPIQKSFKYVKAGGIFSLYRENESLADMASVWSILHWMKAPDDTIALSTLYVPVYVTACSTDNCIYFIICFNTSFIIELI